MRFLQQKECEKHIMNDESSKVDEMKCVWKQLKFSGNENWKRMSGKAMMSE